MACWVRNKLVGAVPVLNVGLKRAEVLLVRMANTSLQKGPAELLRHKALEAILGELLLVSFHNQEPCISQFCGEGKLKTVVVLARLA